MPSISYIIGQALGIVVIFLGFLSFQQTTAKRLLALQTATSFVFAAHYLLLGAYTAVALNLVCAVQNVGYYIRGQRGDKGFVLPVLFVLLTIITSLIVWDGPQSLLIMGGLAILVASLSLTNTQTVRYCMFGKAPLCLAYNVIVGSVGGLVYECAVLTSAIIGIIKHRKKA